MIPVIWLVKSAGLILTRFMWLQNWLCHGPSSVCVVFLLKNYIYCSHFLILMSWYNFAKLCPSHPTPSRWQESVSLKYETNIDCLLFGRWFEITGPSKLNSHILCPSASILGMACFMRSPLFYHFIHHGPHSSQYLYIAWMYNCTQCSSSLPYYILH